mgnify:FL=1
MSYNTKNYQENGDKLVIGETLEIEDGATLTGLPKAANQADSAATTIADLKSDFNDLLAKLKTAGLMEANSENS